MSPEKKRSALGELDLDLISLLLLAGAMLATAYLARTRVADVRRELRRERARRIEADADREAAQRNLDGALEELHSTAAVRDAALARAQLARDREERAVLEAEEQAAAARERQEPGE